MRYYIDKKVEDHEHDLHVLQLKKNSLQNKLDYENNIKEIENIQSEIITLSTKIVELNKVIARYYPNNLNSDLFNL